MLSFFKKNKISLFICLVIATMFIFTTRYQPKLDKVLIDEVNITLEPTKPELIKEVIEVESGSSITSIFIKAGLDSQKTHALTLDLKEFLDLSSIQTNTKFTFLKDPESLSILSIDYSISPIKDLKISELNLEKPRIEWVEKKIQKKQGVYSGIIKTSLWESATASGLDYKVISTLAGVFAGQIDFQREVKPEDKWTILVEEEWVDGKFYQTGEIIAAKYWLQDKLNTAIRYQELDGSIDYFNENGENLKGLFLKSPLKYSIITSKFTQSRFHPILKYNRPHLGVDYSASEGTPVYAVGSGTVVFAKGSSTSGNTIKLRHTSLYETAYKHLSGFAKGVRSGSRVSQGQVIGYVGQTGLATAPHLHFEFYVGGKYVDPLSVKVPRERKIAKNELVSFNKYRDSILGSFEFDQGTHLVSINKTFKEDENQSKKGS